ncbi:MAG: phosphatidylinositol-specific phospholipase C domain-containing protein [Bacteroidota bacterium]
MNYLKHLMFVIALCGIFAMDMAAQCNGYPSLCGKRYNEVSYLTTHNAYNAAENNFQLPNQNFGITRQLNDGVRALMIDVHNLLGTAVVYHSVPILGTATFASVLNEIKTFLDNNPDEVVTIILESYVTSSTIETSLTDAGLMPYAFAKDTSAVWPTLQEMIDSGKRLVLFSDVNDGTAGQDWYLYVWDYAVETPFSITDINQFDCSFNRGDSTNDLFILNHFISDAVTGTGSTSQAAVANANPFLINRAQQCMQSTGKLPNFVTVDFYELGNTLDAVNTLNGVNTGIESLSEINDLVHIAPNPAHSDVQVEIAQSIRGPFSCKCYSITGVVLQQLDSEDSHIFTIPTDNLADGIYIVEIRSTTAIIANKKIVIN